MPTGNYCQQDRGEGDTAELLKRRRGIIDDNTTQWLRDRHITGQFLPAIANKIHKSIITHNQKHWEAQMKITHPDNIKRINTRKHQRQKNRTNNDTHPHVPEKFKQISDNSSPSNPQQTETRAEPLMDHTRAKKSANNNQPDTQEEQQK